MVHNTDRCFMSWGRLIQTAPSAQYFFYIHFKINLPFSTPLHRKFCFSFQVSWLHFDAFVFCHMKATCIGALSLFHIISLIIFREVEDYETPRWTLSLPFLTSSSPCTTLFSTPLSHNTILLFIFVLQMHTFSKSLGNNPVWLTNWRTN